MEKKIADKIELLPVSTLKPYERNNKRHQEPEISRLANSIEKFSWTDPIVIDEENSILAGHKRYAAALKLKMSAVPTVRVIGLSDEEKRAYRIVHNKSTLESEWDIENLKGELITLDEMEFDMSPFISEDWNFEQYEEEEHEIAEVDVSESNGSPLTKLGEVWILGRHRIVCGDSTDKTLVEKLLGKETGDLLITDPPYGVSYVGKTEEKLTIENDDISEDELKKLWVDILDNWMTHLREGGGGLCKYSFRSYRISFRSGAEGEGNTSSGISVGKGQHGSWSL